MGAQITITVRGVEKIVAKLGKLKDKSWMSVFLRAVATVILGDDKSGLRSYAPYKKVTRKQAYGVSFFTDKQRRWFFANMPAVPYRRTGAQGKAWMIESVSNDKAVIANRTASVMFTRGQTALHRIMGWLTAKAQAMKLMTTAKRAGLAAILKYLGF